MQKVLGHVTIEYYAPSILCRCERALLYPCSNNTHTVSHACMNVQQEHAGVTSSVVEACTTELMDALNAVGRAEDVSVVIAQSAYSHCSTHTDLRLYSMSKFIKFASLLALHYVCVAVLLYFAEIAAA